MECQDSLPVNNVEEKLGTDTCSRESPVNDLKTVNRTKDNSECAVNNVDQKTSKEEIVNPGNSDFQEVNQSSKNNASSDSHVIEATSLTSTDKKGSDSNVDIKGSKTKSNSVHCEISSRAAVLSQEVKENGNSYLQCEPHLNNKQSVNVSSTSSSSNPVLNLSNSATPNTESTATLTNYNVTNSQNTSSTVSSVDLPSSSASIKSDQNMSEDSSLSSEHSKQESKQVTSRMLSDPSPAITENRDSSMNNMSSQIGNSGQHLSSSQHHSSSDKYGPTSHMPHSEIRSSTSKDQPLPVSSQNMESSSNRSYPESLPSINPESRSKLSTQESKHGHPSGSHFLSGHEHSHETSSLPTSNVTSHSETNAKPSISPRVSEGHLPVSSSDRISATSMSSINNFSGSVTSSAAHNVPMPPQAHEKSTPHLIPIPSLPTNSMMTPSMSMAPGMNLFPPHMMNPYFGGMMFDPRMAAAFQHPMFRGMPPLQPRYQQGPPQRQPRSRGPRGPRQSKALQQHLPPEVMRHQGRPAASEPMQIKIDPLVENLTPASSSGISTNVSESSQATSSRSSTPRSQNSLTSPVTIATTQNENISHSVTDHAGISNPVSSISTSVHQQSQQPPPAHSHGKLDMHQHSLGQPVQPTNESLPPPAHSSHPSLAMTKPLTTGHVTVSSITKSAESNTSASNIETTLSTAHQEKRIVSNIISSIKQEYTNVVTSTPTEKSNTDTESSVASSVSHDNNTKVSITSSSHEVVTSMPMPAHAHHQTTTVAITTGSVPMPAHVHCAGSTIPGSTVTQMPPTSTLVSSSVITTTSNQSVTTVSSSKPTSSVSDAPHQQSGMPSLSLPMSAHGQHPGSIPSSASTHMPMPAHYHPQGMGPMPGMTGPPFMQQNVRVRGQRMSKQRGATPEMPPGMPPGMMPPFGRFPPGFNPFMSPQIARMAMSQEMMALAQKMSASSSTAASSMSEGEQTGTPPSAPQMPKFEGLTPNQMEHFIRAMRMRPPQFALRPGMQQPPRGMPPPPRYPGLPMPSPTSVEAGGHRFPGMPQHPPSTSGQTTTVSVTSPTSFIRSVQMSPSQSPHPSASPLAPSASPMSSRTGDKTPSPIPRSPANSDTTSVGSTPIKQEPIEQRLTTCFQDEMEEARTATQNALLKQLLATSLAMGGARPAGTPFSEESEDGSTLQLTPEQQKQLEMIESMPVIREVELTPEDWQSKTQEEREKILELRKQAFEEKRREFEDVRKKRKPPAEPRKRKKKEKSVDQAFPEMFVDGQMMVQQPQLQPPPKKRQRRPKQKKVDIEEDKDARVENFLQQLRMLANVPLQEPKVTSAIVNSPVHGSASILTGESQLKGDFGNAYLDGVADFYGSTLLCGLPPLGSLVNLSQPRDIESRRKFLSDGIEAPEQQRKVPSDPVFLGQQRPAGTPPFSISSLTGPAITSAAPTLPVQPRIEPRVLALRTTDSPDTVISSSSPEHDFGEEEIEFPMLKPIDPPSEEDHRCSPSLPLLQPVAIKAESLQVKDEEKMDVKTDNLDETKPVTDADVSDKKLMKLDPTLASLAEKDLNGKTNSFTSSLTHPLKDKDISVTLTLSAKAAEDIGGVLSSIAELLKIAVPPTYQVSRSPSPDALKMNLKHKEDPINIHNLIKMKPKFCRNCDMVVLDKGYFRKKSEMPFMFKEDHFTFREAEDEDIAFCSQKCYERFVMVYTTYFKAGGFQSKLTQSKEDAAFLSDKSPSRTSLSPFPSTPPMISPRGSGFLTPNSSGERTPQLTPTTPTGAPFLAAGMEPATPTRQRLDLEKLPRKHKKLDVPPKPPPKKWKNVRYKKWDPSFSQELQPRPETPKSEVEVLWKALGTIITPDPMPEDKRICVFCQGIGDGVTDGPGRLLNMDVDKWVHLNCALWSSEVYETLNGDLMNVDVAHGRCKTLECQACKKIGATLGCFKVNCSKVYHLGCAQKSGCMFFQDKTILCPPHAPKILPDFCAQPR